MNDTENQVKSKQRVSEHGEVFTAQREVNAMLDLVAHEAERIDARFLEPACGTGNFLVAILKRKLTVVAQHYAKNQLEYERNAILALSSIYGIDILPDNVETCRDRLLGEFTETYLKFFIKTLKGECLATAKFILSRNILWGDALTLKTPDSKAEPIVFSEWSFIKNSLIKRTDYTMAKLLENQPINEANLFSDLGDRAFIPDPVADYPPIHFLKLTTNDSTNKLQS